MSSKRSASDQAPLRPKRKRSSYGFDVKLEVIRRKKSGERVIDIARFLNMPETTIHTILRNATDLENRAMAMVHPSKVKITRKRSDVMEIMERKLASWIEELYEQHIPVSLLLIQEKALSLYEDVRKELGEDRTETGDDFSASKGWFHRFQKRYSLKNVKVQKKAACADVERRESYSADFKNYLESRYSPEHVLNVEEAELCWEQMSSRTYVTKKEKTASDKKEDTVEILPKKELTIEGLQKAFRKIDEAVKYFCDNDPLCDRSAKIKHQMNEVLSSYYTALSEKLLRKKQTLYSQTNTFIESEACPST